MTFRLSKNFHGVSIGPLSKILAVNCLAVYQIQTGGRSQSALTKFFPSLTITIIRGLFRTFELRVLTLLDCPKIAGTNKPIFKIAGAKAPIAPVLNRSLIINYFNVIINFVNSSMVLEIMTTGFKKS